MGVLWKVFRKKEGYDLSSLGFFKRCAYLYHLLLLPSTVVHYNGIYMFERFMALTTTALLMWWSWPVFVFYKVTRGRSFDFDFDELDAEGKKYSNKQGIVYHYFGDSRYQTLGQAYKVHWKDFLLGLFGFIPWLILNVIYWPALGINILTLPL